MMTKRQYAKMIVEDYIRKRCDKRTIEYYSDLSSYVYSNIRLGIALETLDVLGGSDSYYIDQKDALEAMFFDKETGKTHTLTTREMLSLLPDEEVSQ